MVFKDGDKVKVEYEGKFADGTVFDSSEKQGSPLEFVIGSKQVIPGFEAAIKEMEVGQQKEIKLEPKDAYGESNSALLKKVPKDKLPKDGLKSGALLMVGLPDGRQFHSTIKEIGETEVVIDMNHPFAGKELFFKIKIVE